MQSRLAVTIVSALLIAGGAAAPAAATARRAQLTAVIGSVADAPNPVVGADGRRHLAYELQLLNIASSSVRLERVAALDEQSGSVLASWRGIRLSQRVVTIGGGGFSGTIGAGRTVIAVLDVSMPRSAPVPHGLKNQITVGYPGPTPDPSPYVTGRTRVGQQPAVEIGPPLRGSGWVAVNGCCDQLNGHRGIFAPINGRSRFPERFAIDWVQLDRNRRLFTGPPNRLSSYAYFGADILSVANGTVVRTHDGEPENVPGQLPDPITLQNIGGNSVVVAIGGGRYAYYAHLQPHRLRVKVGDHVRRGQVLGLLGNTGNSDAPHLHFHLTNRPSPLDANGLPYEFASFTSPGTVTSFDALASGRPTPIGPRLAGPHVRQLPLDNQVVDFR